MDQEITYQTVDRPTIESQSPLIEALIGTLDNGKAIQFPISNLDYLPWQAKVRLTLKTMGYKFCYRMDNTTQQITCWVIRKEA